MEAAASIRKLSDHSPLIITIWGHNPPPNNPTRYFDVTLMNEEKGKSELLNAWSGDATRPSTGRDWAEWLEEAMKRVANYNTRMAKEKRRTGGTCQILHQEDPIGGAPAPKRPHKFKSEGHTLRCPRTARGRISSLCGVKPPPQLSQPYFG
ncbi:unnamed protein product [Sphagnum jensenii]|uniref:Uncharacterized protein n=2 Tax=Sphagnum jensenii TaxID=128206 RepID=A0ABP1BFN3_9BRYO